MTIIRKAAIGAILCATVMTCAAGSKRADSTLSALKVENVSLTTEGGEMKVSFDLDFSDVKLGSNEQVIYTPIFTGEGDSIVLDKIVLNGRDEQLRAERNPKRAVAGASQTLRRRNGTHQSVSVSRSFPYEDWMDLSKVVVAEDLCGCGDLRAQERMFIGDFDNRPAPPPMMTFMAPKAEAVKARDEKGSAFVDYVVNKTNILPDYRRNRQEIAKIVKTIDLVKNDPNVSITEINIHGYASPEGSYENNARLAEGRAASLKDYVKSLYTLPDNLFTSASTPEDWDGLRKLVEQSTLAEKSEILAIIDDPTLDPDSRDHEIRRRFPQTYQYMLSEWYPGLRHSDYTVSYVVRPFTVEETKEIMKKNPRQVSLNEMFLVAQTYEPGSKEFNEVMDVAVATYPDDPTANLNAACASLNDKDWTKAARYLKKAGNSPEAIHARGVLAMNTGDYDTAETLLTAARDAGIASAEENLKILERLRRLKKQNK